MVRRPSPSPGRSSGSDLRGDALTFIDAAVRNTVPLARGVAARPPFFGPRSFPNGRAGG